MICRLTPHVGHTVGQIAFRIADMKYPMACRSKRIANSRMHFTQSKFESHQQAASKSDENYVCADIHRSPNWLPPVTVTGLFVDY